MSNANERIFNCLVILRGQMENQVKDLTLDELLNLLEDECVSTMDSFWNLVDDNKELKKSINLINQSI
jgi:hypothetical protein